jgi:lipoate-protein ligase A
MKYLDLSFPTAEANLACDEALLDQAEERSGESVLRVWQPASVFVVIGFANRIAREVSLEVCRGQDIPVLRRCSGGGAVVQAPGCLNYSLVLPADEAGPWGTIRSTNKHVMERHRQVFCTLLHREVQHRGDTDLALDERKFSGNAQRRRKRSLLFHGTFLLDLDFVLVEELLPAPSKAPVYRGNRSHTRFLTNLQIPAERVKHALREAWQACKPVLEIPQQRIDQLVKEKYSRAEWNFRF